MSQVFRGHIPEAKVSLPPFQRAKELGFLYPSRTLPGADNAALFDRCRDALAEQDLGALDRWQSDTGNRDNFDILDDQGWGLV
jgi:hypothetical protein